MLATSLTAAFLSWSMLGVTQGLTVRDELDLANMGPYVSKLVKLTSVT